MKYPYLSIIVLIASVFSSASRATEPDASVLEKLDKQLAAAAEAGWESPAEPLQQIESIVFKLPPDSSNRQAIEERLIGVLESTKSPEFKWFLCSQLRVIGTERCVPHVAPLLADEQMSHLARRTLGALESPDAEAALLAALDETEGKLKAGIIDTLADLGSAAAFEPIAQERNNADPMVAKAAIRALGRFGGRKAHEALQTVTVRDDPALGSEVLNSLLQCAEQYVRSNDKPSAAAIYSEFATNGDSPQQKFAGLRGLLVHCDGATTLLMEAIRAPDSQLGAIALVREVQPENTGLTLAVAALLPQIDEPHRAVLIRALGERGDRSVGRFILAQLDATDEPTQLAAVETLGSLGGLVSVMPLLKVASGDSETMGKVARASLTRLSGDGIDTALLSAAQNQDDERTVVAAIKVLTQRRTKGLVTSLLELASDTRASVRGAAIDGLGAVAGIAELDTLLKMARETSHERDRDRIFVSTDRMLSRIAEKDEAVRAVSFAIDTASSANRSRMIALLSSIGNDSALAKAEGILHSPNKLLRVAATEALASWPSADAIDDLENVLEENRSIEERLVALDGMIRLAGMTKDEPVRLLKMIGRTDRWSEKKTLLAALGQSPAESVDALDAALEHINDGRLQATAGLAVIRIANRLRRSNQEKAREALNRVIATVRDDDVRNRAQRELSQIALPQEPTIR